MYAVCLEIKASSAQLKKTKNTTNKQTNKLNLLTAEICEQFLEATLTLLQHVVYYNKEYREGWLREFLPTAAVGICQSRRLRQILTAEVGKNSQGTSQRNFFILSTVPDPLRCLNMSKSLKTNDLSCFRHIRTLPLDWWQNFRKKVQGGRNVRRCHPCQFTRLTLGEHVLPG